MRETNDGNDNRRRRSLRRGLTVAAVAALGAVAPAATASAQTNTYGFEDNSFFAKAHESVTLPLQPGFPVPPAPFRTALRGAPEILQAGAHPDASTGFRIRIAGNGFPPATKDIMVDGPPGFVGSTVAVPTCPMEKFLAPGWGNCPTETQVGVSNAEIGTPGTEEVLAGINSSLSPVFKLPPPPDTPARFGYRTAGGQVVYIIPKLRSDGDYGLRVHASNLPSNFGLIESVTTLWGVPYDPIHNVHRWIPPLTPGTGSLGSFGTSVPANLEVKPMLTNPTYCDSGPLARTVHGRRWADPDVWATATVFGSAAPHGCDKLEFGTVRAPASLDASPDVRTPGSSSGLKVDLRLPYNPDPYGLARPSLRTTEMVLPEGMTVNPSAANGLEACSEEQIGMKSLNGPTCPPASKIADVEVTTPLLEKPLAGEMYIAEQHRNPLGALMALYLHVEGSGVRAKVAGRVERDPVTGQLTTTFKDNPQLPFTHLTVRVKSGARAPLVTPTVCGTHRTTTTLTPWSYPHTGPPVLSTSQFSTVAADGCVGDLAQRGFAPRVSAGTESPGAGRFSPFVARFTREDDEQEFDRITLTAPKGLAGKLKGIPYCTEAGIARAIGRDDSGDGAVEMADPSCGEESRVGTTVVGVGAGNNPYYAKGSVYLAGPYKGAPLSMVFVVPAVAGPFDLGVQVVRTALDVDRRSAQITAVSDEIPKILEGIPLRIRDIRVMIDRPDFTINPTDCSEKRIAMTIRGAQGATAEVGNRFQVGDCAALPFKPRLSLELTGKNQRTTGKHPGVKAVVRQTGVGEAGIKKAKVTLPKSLALDVNNAQALCEFEDGIKDDLENHCPKGSIVGNAQAVSPLLKQPLKGSVYFVKNVRRDPKTGNAIRTLPMIVVALRGEVAINLRGESDTTKAGRLVNTFDQTPDAPITRFDLNMNGGSNGILAVTRTRTAKINLCVKPKSHVANAQMDGQNGKRNDNAIRMKTPCTKKQIKAAKRAAKKAARKAANGGR